MLVDEGKRAASEGVGQRWSQEMRAATKGAAGYGGQQEGRRALSAAAAAAEEWKWVASVGKKLSPSQGRN